MYIKGNAIGLTNEIAWAIPTTLKTLSHVRQALVLSAVSPPPHTHTPGSPHPSTAQQGLAVAKEVAVSNTGMKQLIYWPE